MYFDDYTDLHIRFSYHIGEIIISLVKSDEKEDMKRKM